MNVIELAKECGASENTGKRLSSRIREECIVFLPEELQAFSEAIKRDLLDVGMEPAGYKFIVWDGRARREILAIDYLVQYDKVFGWEKIQGKEPLYTAEQMAHSRSEAVREAVSKQKEKDAKICDELAEACENGNRFSYPENCLPDSDGAYRCAARIRNQGE